MLLVSVIARVIYLSLNADEFEGKPDKKRLDWRFFFMQIPLINRQMLFWSLSFVTIFGVAHFLIDKLSSKQNQRNSGATYWQRGGKDYVCDVMARWLLGYGLFLVFYYSFYYLSGTKEADFDPSGHFACSILA